MLSVPRRLRRARLQPPTPSDPPEPTVTPIQTLPQTQRLTLTTAEFHQILTRRLRNDNLPDDAHTLLAERITTLTTLITSFAAKLYILNRTPLANLPTTNPRLSTILRILTLSQLRPFRVLTLPLIRIFRPLSWLLAPFAAMSLPLAVHLIATAVITHFTPTPPPRPKFVDTLVTRAVEVCDTISETVNRARETVETDFQQFFDQPPPQLPALSDIVPEPFAGLVASQESQSAILETSASSTPSLRRQGTYTRNPVPSFRSIAAPPGLSALARTAVSSSAESTPRPQNFLSSELSSDAVSDADNDKPSSHNRAST